MKVPENTLKITETTVMLRVVFLSKEMNEVYDFIDDALTVLQALNSEARMDSATLETYRKDSALWRFEFTAKVHHLFADEEKAKEIILALMSMMRNRKKDE